MRRIGEIPDVCVTGPLAPCAPAFKSRLKESGYTQWTTAKELWLMLHLSSWLDKRHMTSGDLTSDQLDEYLRSRRAAGYKSFCSRRSLAPLLELLTDLAVLPLERPVPPSTAEAKLLASFQSYLLDERGVAPCTARAYVHRARRFLAGRADRGDVSNISPGDVSRAVVTEAAAMSVVSAQYFVVALRSFLRFCFVEGLVESDLAAAALAVAGRRRSFLPKRMDKSDAEAVLRSCDRRHAVGRRDHAILTTLLRLGLRASEVAGLMLDDIDWRAAEIVVHGKGRRDDRLPLPADVGDAIVGYLHRGRPKTTTRREVFLRSRAPLAGLGRQGVSSIVYRACARAGVAPVGAHQLRHTLACDMVSAGVPLPEIGEVLRHRSLLSTAIYARVDVEALRGLAQPWPGSAG
jgi:site-specific recombinase XerD